MSNVSSLSYLIASAECRDAPHLRHCLLWCVSLVIPLVCLNYTVQREKSVISTGIHACVRTCWCSRPGTDAALPAATELDGVCCQQTNKQTEN